MVTIDEIQTLALRPKRPENSVLTLYLDIDQSRQANLNRGFKRQLKDLLAEVRNRAGQPEVEAFETAAHQMEKFVDTHDLGARGLAAVYDATDGFFWEAELDCPVPNRIRWSRDVLIQPLLMVCETYERLGVVQVDRANLRLLTFFLGEIQEQSQVKFDHKNVRHTKTVGTDHLGSASHAQRRADHQVLLNLRHVAKGIQVTLEARGVEKIVLAGSREVTAELHRVLPKRLASRVIAAIDIANDATRDEIRRAIVPVAERFERQAEEALVRDLTTSASKSNTAVVGLGHTLYAVNRHRVWQLVYAEGFRSPGFECSRCGALFSIETVSCTFCGSSVYGVEDVVEQAIGLAFRNRAGIEIVQNQEAASSLMNAGGIGAFLRTRTASARISEKRPVTEASRLRV